MGSLELGPEADVSQLEPLLTLENIEQLEATFVTQIQVSSWAQVQRSSATSCGPVSVDPRVYPSLAVSVPCCLLLPFAPSSRQMWLSGCRGHWMGR